MKGFLRFYDSFAQVREELHVIFLIDNSGSMEGKKIAAVNNAIRDIISVMPEVQREANADIKIAALKFSDKASWVFPSPRDIDRFRWSDLSADGGTNLSSAYENLAMWLSKQINGGQMPNKIGLSPIIILMTDGVPTSEDWEKKLEILKKREWFKAALRYALAIDITTEEAMEVLRKFTGGPETVLKVRSPEALREVIKVIAVTASKVKTSSNTNTNNNNNNNNNSNSKSNADYNFNRGFDRQAEPEEKNNEAAQLAIKDQLRFMGDVEW